MDLNTILIWTVAASCGVMAVQLYFAHAMRRQFFAPIAVAALLGVLYWRTPQDAGLIGGSVWFALLILPRFCSQWFTKSLSEKHYRRAWWLGKFMEWVPPFSGIGPICRIAAAIQHLNNREQEQALAILEPLRHQKSYAGRMALNLYTRITGEWSAFLDYFEGTGEGKRLVHDLPLLETYLQALAEVRGRSAMLVAYDRYVTSRLEQFPAPLLGMAQTRLAAFCGDELLQMQALSGLHDVVPDDVRRFWKATAQHVAGHTDAAKAKFEELTQCENAAIARAAQHRIDSPLPTIQEQPLSVEERRILDLVRSSVGSVLLEAAFRRSFTPWGTHLLVAALLGVFVLEIPGGTEDYENLIRMGAMLVPADPSGAGWWRPITAAFLHFGPLHLGLNALGLSILGRILERLWGAWRLIVMYLVSAIGSIALTPYFMEPLEPFEQTILIGASGGVMGMIGGLLIQNGVLLWKKRTKALAFQFAVILLVIIVQIFFDSSYAEISSEAHLLGLGFGIAFGILWNGMDFCREKFGRLSNRS